MQIKTLLTTVLIFSLMTSCSFNKIFLQPTKIPATAKGFGMMVDGDTIRVRFSGDNHQPTFMKSRKEVSNLEYTLESVVFKSSSGNQLNGWFLKSKDVTPTITLLHLHGNAGFMFNHYQTVVPLLKKGFQIFIFDYSGFGFSEGNATRENALSDALSALDYLKERPETKNMKVVIYGQSYGGFLSATVASQREKEIDGLVIEGGFSSYKDIAATRIPVLGRTLTKQGYSATTSIKNYHKPLLVIHSTEDKEVPFALGKKIFDNANSPKEFFEIRHQHIYGPIFYGNEISTKIKNMLLNLK